MVVVRALALAVAAVALVTACAGSPHPSAGPPPTAPPAPAAGPSVGLSSATAYVTVIRGSPVRLTPDAAAPVLDAIWSVLGAVPSVAPQADGPRVLVNLRMNEYLVDVTIWRPQRLDVAGARVDGVSGIVIPFTGTWRHRVLLIRSGQVDASPPLPDSTDLETIERAVESAGNHS